jgi:hypothetical protein
MSSDLVLPFNQAGAMAGAGALAASGVVGLVWSSRNEQPGLSIFSASFLENKGCQENLAYAPAAVMLRLCLPWPKRVAACWILARHAWFFSRDIGVAEDVSKLQTKAMGLC